MSFNSDAPIFHQKSDIKGHVFWLTGISGAGKTTLSLQLAAFLRSKEFPVEILDGDVVREFFENDLGYSRGERCQNVRRIAFAAKLLSDHGVQVVVANIAPYREIRDFIRRKLPRYSQIYIKADLESVRSRDAKGHYSRFANGEMKQLIGEDDAYEEPRLPDLVIDTTIQSVSESIMSLNRFAESLLLK